MVESKALYEGDPMARPYVLKPVNEGSSVGVAIVTDEGNYGHPISAKAEGPWLHFERLLAEPFIRGRELTVAVLGDEALCVTELKPKAGFYDFDAKYTDGLTEHVCPADVPADDRRGDDGHGAGARTGCSAARARRGPTSAGTTSRARPGIYLLEVNTQPGMTPLSLVPEQAQAAGHRYGELVERIIAEALRTPRREARR